MGLPPSSPKISRCGAPEGFHDPAGQTIAASHKAMSKERTLRQHDKPVARPFDVTQPFQPQWKPAIKQYRTHNIRDLA